MSVFSVPEPSWIIIVSFSLCCKPFYAILSYAISACLRPVYSGHKTYSTRDKYREARFPCRFAGIHVTFRVCVYVEKCVVCQNHFDSKSMAETHEVHVVHSARISTIRNVLYVYGTIHRPLVRTYVKCLSWVIWILATKMNFSNFWVSVLAEKLSRQSIS